MTPAGPEWVKQFPTSTSLDDLAQPFQSNCRAFIAELEAEGCRVTISATYRPSERAYLMPWVLIYKEMTGKMPWNDKESKLMAVPAPHWLRRSRVGTALWGKGPEVGYINLNFFNPLIMRGGRAMGIPGEYEAHVLHGNFGQELEAAQRDMMNSFAQLFLGPPVKAAFVGLTGDEPYLTGLRDREGHIGLQFFPMIPPKTKPGLPTIGQRGIAALREINSFYGSVGEATGLLGQDQGLHGNKWARMLSDYTVPGLVGNSTNPFARSEILREQRTGTR